MTMRHGRTTEQLTHARTFAGHLVRFLESTDMDGVALVVQLDRVDRPTISITIPYRDLGALRDALSLIDARAAKRGAP